MEKNKGSIKGQLVLEFKRSLKERIHNTDLSYMYQKFFFEDFIDEEESGDILEYYQTLFEEEPDDWFCQFHKSIRQTDFFGGRYIKIVDTLTEEEKNRRNQIIKERRDFRKDNSSNQELPHTKELLELNNKKNTEIDVPIGGIMDGLLHSLIHLDNDNELMKCMEITFKICSLENLNNG